MTFYHVSDTQTVENIKNVCRHSSDDCSLNSFPTLDSMFFTSSSTQVRYNLEVCS